MTTDPFEPRPEHKFSFGLWTVGNPGRDPFGDPVRPRLSPGEIAALLADEAFSALKAPIKRIGGKEAPVPVSPSMESAVVPGEKDIVRIARDLIAA